LFEKSQLKEKLEGTGLDSAHSSSLEKSSERSRLSIGGGFPPFLLEEEDDNRPLKIAVVVAILLHVAFVVIRFPELREPPRYVGPKTAVFLTQQVRFKPPPPRAKQEIPKKRKAKKTIPIPDTTPEEPEPIRVIEEIDLSDTDLPEGEEVFGIPDAPAGSGDAVSGAMQIAGNVAPPVKIHEVRPNYTEEARQARIQGVVILQAVIDTEGKAVNIKILKGLPMGLNETAIAAVEQWLYKPATLEGEPVPVYYNITISFHLQ
jgi:TonB family protein